MDLCNELVYNTNKILEKDQENLSITKEESMATSSRNTKRDSNQIDKLMAKVDKLVTDQNYSVNRACAEVGIQATVYYYRKRKDIATAQGNAPVPNIMPVNSQTARFDASHLGDKGIEALKKEYFDLENRLQAIKIKIAEKVMGNMSGKEI